MRRRLCLCGCLRFLRFPVFYQVFIAFNFHIFYGVCASKRLVANKDLEKSLLPTINRKGQGQGCIQRILRVVFTAQITTHNAQRQLSRLNLDQVEAASTVVKLRVPSGLIVRDAPSVRARSVLGPCTSTFTSCRRRPCPG